MIVKNSLIIFDQSQHLLEVTAQRFARGRHDNAHNLEMLSLM